ncbi:MAG TPA: IclR family transcriptional regulator [Myxococcota bacterium]|nr:IclR family transcriptional regulator [Myxococcota bacterium]
MDKTLLKGLEVLEALAHSEASRGVSDLARALGLTKSNVHRTLQTLAAGGYVRKNAASGAYECTMKLPQLARAILGRVDLKHLAEPHLEALAAATRETVHLSVLEDRDVFYLHKIDSPQPVRAYSEVSGRAPAHCVATGKALLAFQDEALLRRFGRSLDAYTPRTLASLAALREELGQVRRQGYAVNRGEWRESVGGLAAPVFDGARRAVAAVGISGPVERLRPARMKALAPAVVRAARAISEALGYPGP